MSKKLLHRVYRALFPRQEQSSARIEKGEQVAIDPTSISLMTTQGGGVIRLIGNNYVGRTVEMGTGETISIGYGATVQDRCIILGDVAIGEYCILAPNVYISSGRHYYDQDAHYIRDQDEIILADPERAKAHSKKIFIEDDCWIGINAVILPGVRIGRGSVIAANSLVVRDVAPFSVVAGVPAELIKKRLDFKTKQSIQFDNDSDLPNFYQGFFVSKKELDVARTHGGIAAGGVFVLYLGTGRTLTLQCKKTTSEPLTLIYNNQTRTITETDFTTVTFDAADSAYHEVSVEGSSGAREQYLLLQRASLG